MTTKTEVLLPAETTLLDLYTRSQTSPEDHPRLAAICEAAIESGPWFASRPLGNELAEGCLADLEESDNHYLFAAQWLAQNTLALLDGFNPGAAAPLYDYQEVENLWSYELLADNYFVSSIENASKEIELDSELHFSELVRFFTMESGLRFPFLIVLAPEAGLNEDLILNTSRLFISSAECWVGWMQERSRQNPGQPFDLLAAEFNLWDFWDAYYQQPLWALLNGAAI
jgi:hypothetical protein